jgi:hypothetical protein
LTGRDNKLTGMERIFAVLVDLYFGEVGQESVGKSVRRQGAIWERPRRDCRRKTGFWPGADSRMSCPTIGVVLRVVQVASPVQ